MKKKIILITIGIIIGVLIIIFLILEIFGLRINYKFFTYKEPDIPNECKGLPSVITSRWQKQIASECPNCYSSLQDTYYCLQEKRPPLFYRIK